MRTKSTVISEIEIGHFPPCNHVPPPPPPPPPPSPYDISQMCAPYWRKTFPYNSYQLQISKRFFLVVVYGTLQGNVLQHIISCFLVEMKISDHMIIPPPHLVIALVIPLTFTLSNIYFKISEYKYPNTYNYNVQCLLNID